MVVLTCLAVVQFLWEERVSLKGAILERRTIQYDEHLKLILGEVGMTKCLLLLRQLQAMMSQEHRPRWLRGCLGQDALHLSSIQLMDLSEGALYRLSSSLQDMMRDAVDAARPFDQ